MFEGGYRQSPRGHPLPPQRPGRDVGSLSPGGPSAADNPSKTRVP